MGLQTVRNGLVGTIQGFGRWAASEVSTCDFGVAEMSASCVILSPGTTIQRPTAYGTMGATSGCRHKEVTHEISGYILVKDTGDPTALLSALWQGVDDFIDSVGYDDTLGGTAEAALVTRVSRPSPDAFITSGNHEWGYLTFTVQATEYR